MTGTPLSRPSSRQINVNIAEMVISEDPGVVLAAPNLGSCLGIAVYDPGARVGGLIHCLLPTSTRDPEKARERPYMFVDTGVVRLLEGVLKHGGRKNNLVVSVAGGAQINDDNGVFEIGKKNYTVLRKLLWANSLLIEAEDVGGKHCRTITLNIATGEVAIKITGYVAGVSGK